MTARLARGESAGDKGRMMSLYARTCDVEKVDNAFPTVGRVRDLLMANGFLPLVQIQSGEHWVRGPRRVILVSRGPGKSTEEEPLDLVYATLVRVGDGWMISLD